MAEGPTGIQGFRGAKGSRGPKGIEGWGYGTTTGPTGGIGSLSMTNISGEISTIVLTSSTSGTFYRFFNLTFTQFSYKFATIDITSLSGQPSGLFWIFSNDTPYIISLSTTSAYLSQINIGDSITIVWNGSNIVIV
jgi:hypothetical protein